MRIFPKIYSYFYNPSSKINEVKSVENDFSPINVSEVPESSSPKLVSEQNSGISILFIGFQLLVLCAIFSLIAYYSLKILKQFTFANAFFTKFEHTMNAFRVGETITLKLMFRVKDEYGNEVACNDAQFKDISKILKVEINEDSFIRSGLKISLQNSLNLIWDKNKKNSTTIIHDYDSNVQCIFLRFSIRLSGRYEVKIKSGDFFSGNQFWGSPYAFLVLPGHLDLTKTCLETPNPNIVYIESEQYQKININSFDRYSNKCFPDLMDSKGFHLAVKIGDVPIFEPEVSWSFQSTSEEVFLNIRAIKANIYKCKITYKDKAIRYSSFNLVSLSPEENEKLNLGMNNLFYPPPGSCHATLLSIGSDIEDDPKEVWIAINYNQISISSNYLGILYHPFYVILITRRTRLIPNGTIEVDVDENLNGLGLIMTDGIKDPISLRINASDARVLFATFGKYQGLKMDQTEYLTFQEKVAAIKYQLDFFGLIRYFQWPYHVKGIDTHEVFETSEKALPVDSTDWQAPFSIELKDLSNMPTEKWLETLNEAMISKENPKSQNLNKFKIILPRPKGNLKLFSTHKSSKLVYPTSEDKRDPKFEIEDYVFAGCILGKCVFDSICGRKSPKFHHRFTKSFLAEIIGIPVTYKHFETDDPLFYHKHVEPILNSKEDVTRFNFTYEESDDEEINVTHAPKKSRINLIPNGKDVNVNKLNKEKYLNCLAIHKLSNRYKPEIQAFLTGFYKVVPQACLVNLNEDEFEKMICGGGKTFDVDELKLKTNHRIYGDFQIDTLGSSSTNMYGLEFTDENKKKMMRWFWAVVENMTYEEREQLLKMTTGSCVLPPSGFEDLTPKFTISLTGNFNESPKFYPILHQIHLGNHSSFEFFEKTLLDKIHGLPEENPEYTSHDHDD